MHQLGLPHLAAAAKSELRQQIGRLEFDPGSLIDRHTIITYCFSDCDALPPCTALGNRIDPAVLAHWVEFLKGVARMELRGIPIDAKTTKLILRLARGTPRSFDGPRQSDRIHLPRGLVPPQVLPGLVPPHGDRVAPQDQPDTGRAYRPLDDETMKDMESRHTFIGQVRQVLKTVRYLGRRSIKIDGRTRRHYFNTSPFRSVTGRNQPRKFIFSAQKSMRWLVIPESPEHVLTYVDYVAQEVGIAAALSGDPVLRAVYETEDAHLAFAIRAGTAPAGATKESHPEIRKRYKTVSLGVLYGQTAFGVSARLGIPVEAAQAILDQHRGLFPTFWAWSERVVQAALDRRKMRTPCGWASSVPPSSNERTWMNFPVQATGGDIMP